MNKDDDKWVELPVTKVGQRPDGDIYPEEVLRAAVNAFSTYRNSAPLRGEVGQPTRRERESSHDYINRFCSIDLERVSHLVDVNTFTIKNGVVFAKVKPHGPMADLARQGIAQNNIKFGMRAQVRYQEGHTTQTEARTVEYCDIITFDLINPDN